MNSPSKPQTVINYYLICHRLKDVIRTGWQRWQVDRARLESVAEHIYGTQMLAIAMHSEYHYDLNLAKIILMLTVHELGEAIIGDQIQFEISDQDKAPQEHAAVQAILSPLTNGQEILALFEEFDTHDTPEARFAYQCDKLEADFQCKLYDQEHCVDLACQPDNPIMQDPLVAQLLAEGNSWSNMWLKFTSQTIPYDQNFRTVSDYAIQHGLNLK